jgi:hypothetical protein
MLAFASWGKSRTCRASDALQMGAAASAVPHFTSMAILFGCIGALDAARAGVWKDLPMPAMRFLILAGWNVLLFLYDWRRRSGRVAGAGR